VVPVQRGLVSDLLHGNVFELLFINSLASASKTCGGCAGCAIRRFGLGLKKLGHSYQYKDTPAD